MVPCVNLIRGLAVVGLCGLLATTPTAAAAQQPVGSLSATVPPNQPPPPPSDQPPPPPAATKHHDKTGDVIGGVVIGSIVACLIFCGRAKAHADSASNSGPSREELLNEGPQVSDVQPLGAFAVYGFIRDGWPIVVDYQSDPDSATWLTVTVGGKTWTQGLESGRNFAKLVYKGGGASESKPALFTVQSASRVVGGSGEPRPIEIVGIGAGPRAVGSVAIEQLHFATSERRVGGDFARFDYHTKSAFNRVVMDVLRYGPDTRNGRPVITVATAAQYGAQALPPGVYGPRMWGGLDTKTRKPSHGVHRLQVRGWETDEDESWVNAISTGYVQVP